MKRLNDSETEMIRGGDGLVVSPTTKVITKVDPTTKIRVGTLVANQTNVGINTLAVGGVNSSFSGSQYVKQVNALKS